MDLALNNQKGWYAIKPKQPTNLYPFIFFKPVKFIWKNVFIFSHSIMWWLTKEVGFLYGVTNWYKIVITKWRSVEFFFQLKEIAHEVIYKLIN